MLQGMVRALSLGSLVVAAFWLATPQAEAAKISVKNCQSTTIRLCVYDKDPVVGGTSQKDDKILKQDDRIHSKCGSACRLAIVVCTSDTSCNKCYSYSKAVKGKFGRGTYALVKLDQDSSDHNKYKNSDFVEVSSDPTDNDQPISCP